MIMFNKFQDDVCKYYKQNSVKGQKDGQTISKKSEADKQIEDGELTNLRGAGGNSAKMNSDIKKDKDASRNYDKVDEANDLHVKFVN